MPSTAAYTGPLGATIDPSGIQFAVHAPAAPGIELLLFESSEAAEPNEIVLLDSNLNKSGSIWHIFVAGAKHGQIYNWRIANQSPQEKKRALLDPYGTAVAGWQNYDRNAAQHFADNTHCALRSVAIDLELYDWQTDETPAAPKGREFIYELHVGGYTAHFSSGLEPGLRGTYAGLTARIDHLVSLGVTAVELMPVSSYDPQDAPTDRTNVWGYNPVSFFAPHAGYASSTGPCDVLDEFRDMVRELHRAGIRVIMDVVYNHTAEAGPDGPTICWRGLDEFSYYIGDATTRSYQDHTGCGNTYNANHPVASQMILDSLCHWVKHFHIDGFRFDLAAAMTRDEQGHPMDRPPTLWAINDHPLLQNQRLIAEAWDTSGLHLLHHFPGDRFACWNGPYRDTVRRFLKGDHKTIEELMARIVGSRDIFDLPEQRPTASINFVTCHDGFTLRDLVTYEQKNNWENGEDNRDGSDHNLNWNSGHEGPSDDPELNKLRERRLRNHLVLLFFSLGTPMMLAGDEWGQSRQGNNNPWCLANEVNWLDWDLANQNADLLRFVRHLVRFSNATAALAGNHFWSVTSPGRPGDITWHGTEPHLPDWSPPSRHLAYELVPPPETPQRSRLGSGRMLILLNSEPSDLTFQLVSTPQGEAWHKVIDTALTAPHDIQTDISSPISPVNSVCLPPHTVVVLIAKT